MKYLCIYEGENPSAGIISNNGIEIFIEEERLNRIKHASHMYPIRSILRSLTDLCISLHNIDAVAYPWNLDFYAPNGVVERFYNETNKNFPPDDATLCWQQANLRRNCRKAVEERFRSNIQRFLNIQSLPPFVFTEHHKAHAWSSLIGSGLNDCLVLVTDGSGETLCTSIWLYRNSELRFLWGRHIPHSLGWLYAAMTEFLGFDAYDGEYKAMGAAGLPTSALLDELVIRSIISTSDDGYSVHPKFIHHGKHTYSTRFTDALVELLNFQPCRKYDKLSEPHLALIKTVQAEIEKNLTQICKKYLHECKCKNLALAGGVALNVKLNGHLLKNLDIEVLYVNPFPNDTGSALGVVMEHDNEIRKRLCEKVDGLAFLGPKHTKSDVQNVVIQSGYKYTSPSDPAMAIAELIKNEKTVALCIGRSESGQRALGHRSIIGNPSSKNSYDKINNIIKRREPWRPLCPSIIEEDVGLYTKNERISPYMMVAVEATPKAVASISSVIHADGTMRPQLVRKCDNPFFYEIILNFKTLSGIGVLINTSFNVDGQPMIESPKEALATFASTNIDALYIDGFLIVKEYNV